MYGKTVRLSDETIDVLEKFRVKACEEYENDGAYFTQKMVERMSLSELILFGIESLLLTSEKLG